MKRQFYIIIDGSKTMNHYGFLKDRLKFYFENLIETEITIITSNSEGTATLVQKFAREENHNLLILPAATEKQATYRQNYVKTILDRIPKENKAIIYFQNLEEKQINFKSNIFEINQIRVVRFNRLTIHN